MLLTPRMHRPHCSSQHVIHGFPAKFSVLLRKPIPCRCSTTTHLETNQDTASTSQPMKTHPNTGLELPDIYYQLQPDKKAKKALKAEFNKLMADEKMQKVQLGHNGITQTFLNSCMDVLKKHGKVRLRMLDGCEHDMDDAATILEAHLDAVCIQQLGSTLTFYRETAHPRPSNLPAHMPALPEPVVKPPKVKARPEPPKNLPPQFTVL